jgi:hypothetical protein
LLKDRVKWDGESPDASMPVRIQVTVLDAASTPLVPGSGPSMASALQEIADRGGLPELADASAWQREVRADRPLPGRAD